MKLYMLFMGSDFYPNGGWEDFHGYFYYAQDAMQFVYDNKDYRSFAWAHIVYEGKILLIGKGEHSLDKNEFWTWSNPR